MNKIESVIYNFIKYNPRLKNMVRDIYQAMLYLVPVPSERSAYPVTVREGFFFGFHDKNPWSSDNKYLLAHGYSILLHHIGMATIPTLYRRLAYDPVNGFETLGLVTEVPMTLIARRNIEANNLAELVALIRRRGENLNYANAGIGAASHLCGLLLMKAVDTRMTTVPYRGTGPAMNDLVGGTVDIMCDQTTNTTEQIRAGTVRAFAVTTEERVASLPDLPTSAQGGLPGFEVSVWHGLYAPKGTPAPIVARLNQALVKALQDEGIARRFADLGTAPVPVARATPQAHREFWQADIAKWRPLIQAAGQFAD